MKLQNETWVSGSILWPALPPEQILIHELNTRLPDKNYEMKLETMKEVLFTPTSLVFTNNKGMSIEILDEEGIRITSDKSVFIKSDEAIQIASLEQSVSVIAPESIVLEQGQTKMTIQDEIHLDGAQVHIE